MSATVRLADGTVGYYTRRGDDCWPAVAATVLQVPLAELGDLRLDERLLSGMSHVKVDRAAKADVKRWLTARGVRLVEHRRLPVHLPRWLGVIPFEGFFVSHCVCMSYGEILFDPTPPLRPVDLAILRMQVGRPFVGDPAVWRSDQVEEGFSFEPLYPQSTRE